MASTAPGLIAALVFTSILAAASPARAEQDERQTLVLHVADYANVPTGSLARAQAELSRLYLAAGIHTAWTVVAATPAANSDGAMHVTVVLLGEAMSARKIETEGIGDNVLGRAARETARAYIFMKRLEHAARRQGRDFNAVLGRVLAHEVGHLLLPGRGHSNRGIMRDTLDSWSARGETFTPSQRQQIQMRLSGRSER